MDMLSTLPLAVPLPLCLGLRRFFARSAELPLSASVLAIGPGVQVFFFGLSSNVPVLS